MKNETSNLPAPPPLRQGAVSGNCYLCGEPVGEKSLIRSYFYTLTDGDIYDCPQEDRDVERQVCHFCYAEYEQPKPDAGGEYSRCRCGRKDTIWCNKESCG